MVAVAARASISIALILGIVGIFQVPAITYPLLIFIAAGIIPGTDIAIPPDVVLLMVGAVLMAMTLLLYRVIANYRSRLASLEPQYEVHHDDPSYETLVPAWRGALEATRAMTTAANNFSLEIYFWFKELRRPAAAQAIAVHDGLRSTLVRMDRWTLERLRQPRNWQYVKAVLRHWVAKARLYILRLTMP
jgi:hypothetical protein